MQCKDIPDEVFLDAVQRAPARVIGRSRWDARDQLETVFESVPEKLFLAKARKLIVSGKLNGCPCGCRGDYLFPEED